MPSVRCELWGKSHGLVEPYPLIAHICDTAAVALQLLGDAPERVQDLVAALFPAAGRHDGIRLAAMLCGLHDLGKATPEFQYRRDAPHAAQLARASGLPEAEDGHEQTSHAYATQMTLPEALVTAGFELSTPLPLSGLTGLGCALGGHHGRYTTMGEAERECRPQLGDWFGGIGEQAWADERAAIVGAVAEVLCVSPTAVAGSPAGLVALSGLTVLADWLASGDDMIGEPGTWSLVGTDLRGFFTAARERAAAVVNAAGLSPVGWRPTIGFTETFGFPPRPLQDSIDRYLQQHRSPGVLVVAAPMGVGKTEAAFRAAELMGGSDSGLFIALPTTATADAMFGRLGQHVETRTQTATGVSLAHGLAGLSEAYLGLPEAANIISDDGAGRAVGSRWLRGRRRALLAPVAAGTIDQALTGALPVKFGFLRLFALTGKTVVIDEAHALTPYMAKLTETMLEWLGALHVPVVVLSATMPGAVAAGLVDAWCRGADIKPPHRVPSYPGWLHVGLDGTVAGAEVPQETVELAVELLGVRWSDDHDLYGALLLGIGGLGSSGAALVVVNTVSDAQGITDLLAGWASSNDVELLCLHSRMRFRDRRRITDHILGQFGKGSPPRPNRAVVIATQVVEQSLDVDFDVVVSALAPVAPLLQRAGRSHRHVRDRSSLPTTLQTPRLVVLDPVDESNCPSVPRGWRYVYPEVYLTRTRNELLAAEGRVMIPGDVQALVDAVYGALDEPFADADMLAQADAEWSERQLAARITIPTPSNLTSLAELSHGPFVDEGDDMLATRLGLSTMWLLLLDSTTDGRPSLDGQQLPELPTSTETRWLIDACIPVRPPRGVFDTPDEHRPVGWAEHSLLADIRSTLRRADGTYELAGLSYRYDAITGWRRA